MQTPMTSCHLIPMWHKWNANIDGIMMTWFTLFTNLVTSCLACAMSACMHGTCALNKYGASKYWSGLACTQPDSNLGKITTSHFQVLNAQNANDCKCFDVEAISCVTVRSVLCSLTVCSASQMLFLHQMRI